MSVPDGVDLSTGNDGLGVIAFRGADTARYLQGQLSADIETLANGASTLAGLHNPQGRVVAMLALVRSAAEEIFAVLPRELTGAVTARLRKYVLRAKVTIEDVSAVQRVIGVRHEAASSAWPAISWGERRLLLVPCEAGNPAPADSVALAQWENADVAAGLPQVYAATSEQFVAQMLNLDLLGAVAFDKGCYTGQEVIARAHYRGRVKRRMQRWHNASGTMLEPGDAARGADGRALVVVRTAQAGGGRQEVLAVGTFGAAESGETGAADTAVRLSGPLSLPYSLPE